MIEKLLLILSITANTLGLKSVSLDIDRSVTASKINPTISAEASLNQILPQIAVRPKVSSMATTPKIYAKSYLLIDEESGTILTQESAHDRLPIASTTKIMTAVIVLENYKLDDTLTVSRNAASQIGVDLQTFTGEKAEAGSFLKLLLLNSSNRAAFALAEHMNAIGEEGTDKFLRKMNAKAKELGMVDTDYHDPAGLDVTGYSTAYDLYLVTKYALKYPVFREIVKTPDDSITDITGKTKYELHNSNRLVRDWRYSGAIGVKTGYMPEASHTLVGAVERDGHTLISVVLGTIEDTPQASALESKKLFDWGFANTKWE